MWRALVVQSLEMSAIVGQHSATEGMGSRQDDWVRFRWVAIFLCSKDVMAELPQVHDDWACEVLVGVKQHQPLLHEAFFAFFIFFNCPIDFRAIRRVIVPSGL